MHLRLGANTSNRAILNNRRLYGSTIGSFPVVCVISLVFEDSPIHYNHVTMGRRRQWGVEMCGESGRDEEVRREMGESGGGGYREGRDERGQAHRGEAGVCLM